MPNLCQSLSRILLSLLVGTRPQRSRLISLTLDAWMPDLGPSVRLLVPLQDEDVS
jgi:hypothetical protein